MKIIKQQFLRGPNLYLDTPCLLTVLDLGDLDQQSTAALPGFVDRLLGMLPTLQEHRCSRGEAGGLVERMREGTDIAHVLEHVTIELQCLAGSEVGFGFEREVRNKPGQYRVVRSYQFERVAEQAFSMAMAVVHACATQAEYDFPAALAARTENVHGRRCAGVWLRLDAERIDRSYPSRLAAYSPKADLESLLAHWRSASGASAAAQAPAKERNNIAFSSEK